MDPTLTCVPIKGEVGAQHADHVRTQREGGICEPSREAAEGPAPWTVGLQNCEKMSLCRLNHAARGTRQPH